MSLHEPSVFVGAWALEDWRIEYPDGRVTRPFGEGASGYILYAENGVVSASIAAADRRRLGIANARLASAEDKARSFDSYFHYAGHWRVDGDHVVHDVTMALNPDMSGTQQRRRAEFRGRDQLILSAEEEITNAKTRRHILQWKRVKQPV